MVCIVDAVYILTVSEVTNFGQRGVDAVYTLIGSIYKLRTAAREPVNRVTLTRSRLILYPYAENW
jgi:hypothetical protein